MTRKNIFLEIFMKFLNVPYSYTLLVFFLSIYFESQKLNLEKCHMLLKPDV